MLQRQQLPGALPYGVGKYNSTRVDEAVLNYLQNEGAYRRGDGGEEPAYSKRPWI